MPSSDYRPVNKALLLLEGGKAKKAFASLKQLAESGNEGAFHMLGYLYDVGEGTKRNTRAAMHWYQRGYETGNATSAANIATVYRDAGNAKKEFEWYKRAAALDDGDAELEVAIRLLSGKGVRRNVKTAIRLLRKVLVSSKDNTTEASRDVAKQLLWGFQTKRRGA